MYSINVDRRCGAGIWGYLQDATALVSSDAILLLRATIKEIFLGRAVVTLIIRRIVAGGLATLTSAAAQNTGMGVVFGSGDIYLNGAQLSNSNALVAGDVVQTKENGSGMISANGSSLALDSNTIVRFQGASVALDRGAVKVASGQQLSVNARDLKIEPTSKQWAQFYVTRASGTITVIALKNDVSVSCGGASVTVKEGHQLSRYDADNCGLARKGNQTPAAARGPILTSARATQAAAAVGVGLTVWALWQCEDPVSPDSPEGRKSGSENSCH